MVGNGEVFESKHVQVFTSLSIPSSPSLDDIIHTKTQHPINHTVPNAVPHNRQQEVLFKFQEMTRKFCTFCTVIEHRNISVILHLPRRDIYTTLFSLKSLLIEFVYDLDLSATLVDEDDDRQPGWHPEFEANALSRAFISKIFCHNLRVCRSESLSFNV